MAGETARTDSLILALVREWVRLEEIEDAICARGPIPRGHPASVAVRDIQARILETAGYKDVWHKSRK